MSHYQVAPRMITLVGSPFLSRLPPCYSSLEDRCHCTGTTSKLYDKRAGHC